MHLILFHLLLVLLPTQLGLHTWPSWAMVLGRRVDFLSPTFYLTDGIIILLLVSWMFAKKTNLSVSAYKILLFFVLAGLNIYVAVNRFVAAYYWIKVLEYVFLGLYVYTTKPKFAITVFYLSIGVFYSSLIAIGQFVLQRSIGGPLWFLGERTFTNLTPGIAQFYFHQLWLRAYGTFPHPNVLGGFLAILLPLILTRIKNRKQIFYIATVILGTVALAVTFSRSAWVALFIGLVLAKRKLLIPLLIILTVSIVLISGTLGLQDESVVVRQELNNSAIAMFLESPLVGKGLGNFLVELPSHLVSRQVYFLQPAHNIFLLILAEIGVVGFMLFTLVLWTARKKWVLIPILFLGFFDHYFLTLQQGQLLLTILLSSTIAL